MPFISGGRLFGWRSPDVTGWFERRHWFLISDIAALIRGVGRDVSFATLIILLLVPLSAWILWRTQFGLRLRSSGEAPYAASSLGVNISRVRYQGMAISGALAGLGGAFLSVVASSVYREGQTGGQGFIGLATTIFGNWRPAGVLSGGVLFGFATALRLRDAKNVPALFLVLAMALLIMGILALRKRHVDRRHRLRRVRDPRRHRLRDDQRAPPGADLHHAARDHPDRAGHRLATTATSGVLRPAVPRRRVALARRASDARHRADTIEHGTHVGADAMQLIPTLLHDQQRSVDRADQPSDPVEVVGRQRQPGGRVAGGRIDTERHDHVVGIERVHRVDAGGEIGQVVITGRSEWKGRLRLAPAPRPSPRSSARPTNHG